MRTAFFGLHVAASGLNTARGNLNVISHNLSNSEIPGYSRQVAQMQAGRPLTVGDRKGMYGTGSQITSIIQIRDRFLDKKFWSQSAIQGRFSAISQNLSFVETVFNETSGLGTQNSFNTFFSSLQTLTYQAHESTYRTNVTTIGETLTEQVRQNALALQKQQQDLNREFADVIVNMNDLGRQIADLNEQIHIFERNGDHANDLRDQRALLIDRLSALVNIEVIERDFSRPGIPYDTRLAIRINGNDFIDHTRLNSLELVAREDPADTRAGAKRNEMDAYGLYEVFFTMTGSRFNIHSATLGGQLRGIVDVRDGNGGQISVPNQVSGMLLVQDQLDSLTRSANFLDSLVVQFNAMAGGLGAAITLRDESLLALGGAANSREARAYLTNLTNTRSERANLNASLASLRNNIIISTGITTIRNAVTAAVGDDMDDHPLLQTLLDELRDHMETLSDVATVADLTAFETELSGLLAQLLTFGEAGGPLEDKDVLETITQRMGNLNNITAGLRVALTSLDEIAATHGDVDTLEARITAADTALTNLNNAVRDIDDIIGFGNRIETQISWLIQNTEGIRDLVQERIDELVDGTNRIPGNVEEYRAFLTDLERQLEEMYALQDDIDLPPEGNVYADEATLTALVTALQTAIGGVGPGLSSNIAIISASADTNLSEGISVNHGETTTFKGIPFYMNQLNHLVRTFARAINEGRNTDGYDIHTAEKNTAVGHIFGYDANGENKSTLFFTFNDEHGNPATLLHDDPFMSLRMWIIADADGNPARDADGNLITVQDPNPPVDGDGVSIVARDKNGLPMFTLDYSRLNAINFIVNPDLLKDPSLVATSSSHNLGISADDVIKGFIEVGNDVSLFREGKLIDFVIATSNHLGVDNQQAQLFEESYEEMVMQTHNHRLSVMGVDTEEEMLNLVRFQNMFIAASKLLNVLDTVYDTLINRLGNM
ncbi:MAG: flagellar hook-associated protein FlgK [Defluviitaleaceae bacterium]|nr:flagellar hook-associated protein FlgK [Defluviitaleaceae bacterium]